MSVDHGNYSRTWADSINRISIIEPVFPVLGIFLNGLIHDYRYVIAGINAFLYRKLLLREYGLLTGGLILFHPFTVFGLGNTILSFTACLWFVAYNGRIQRYLSVFIHKGAFFLILLQDFRLLIIFLVLLPLLPILLLNPTLQSFEVTLSSLIFKYVFVVTPLLLLSLIKGTYFRKTCIIVSFQFILLIALWALVPKVADRVIYVIYVANMVFIAEIISKTSKRNKFVALFIAFGIPIAGFFHPSVLANI